MANGATPAVPVVSMWHVQLEFWKAAIYSGLDVQLAATEARHGGWTHPKELLAWRGLPLYPTRSTTCSAFLSTRMAPTAALP
jgi:hypothetical protein